MNFIRIILLTIVSFTLLLFSCEKNNGKQALEPPPCVFKFKEGRDYPNLVYVCLNDEKTHIIGYSTYNDIKWDTISDIIDIYKNYYFAPQGGIICDINTAYLSITIDEYEHIDDTITIDYMEKLIIDKDPFAEYYVDENNYLVYDENSKDNYWLKENEQGSYDTIWHVYDTAKFHRLVDNNELGEYLIRLK